MSVADDIRQLQETLDLIEAGIINEYDDPIMRMAKKKGAAAGKKVAQNISMGGPGKWAKPFKTTKGPNDYEWSGIDPKTGMGTYKVTSLVTTKGGVTSDTIVTTTIDKFGRVRDTSVDTASANDKGEDQVGQHGISGQDATTYDKMGRKTSQASMGTDVKQTAPGVHKVNSRTTDYTSDRVRKGV